jgi:hypothetical protein
VAADTPRFDHDPVTLEPKGLLIVGARTNLALQSQDLASSQWSRIRTSAHSPIEIMGLPFYQIARTSTTQSAYIQQTINVTAGLPVTLSLRVKLTEVEGNGLFALRIQGIYPERADAVFDISNGTVTFTGNGAGWSAPIVASIVQDGEGVWLVSLSTTPATNVILFLLGPAGSSNGGWEASSANTGEFFVTAIQLEVGAFASSYIPTTTSQVTRAADVAGMFGENFSSWFNPVEGTLYAEFRLMAMGSAPSHILNINDGTATNNLIIFQGSSGAAVQAGRGSLSSGLPVSIGVSQKAAFGIRAGENSFYLNGTADTGAAFISSAVVRPWDRLLIGNRSTGDRQMFGHIRRITYWNTRLPNETLQQLTTLTE